MTNDTASDHLPPPDPARPSNPDIEEYYWEPVYWRERAETFPVDFANLITARCLSRWASRYRATVYEGSDDPSMYRQGNLPADPEERDSIISELFDWADAMLRDPARPRGFMGYALTLFRGDDLQLIMEDNLPFRIFLSPDEFKVLQLCWEEHGLPRDLCYPRTAVRSVVEATPGFSGEPVLQRRFYSPLEWSQRDTQLPSIPISSEEERARAFYDACMSFERVVLDRSLQLSEPGRTADRETLEELDTLLAHVILAMFRAIGLPQDQFRRYKRSLERRLLRHWQEYSLQDQN